MFRQGELTYYETIGEGGRKHALSKPFSDERVGALLMEAGAVMALLPSPPAKVLDCGCGTGWLSYFLAKSGYETTGVDVAKQAIELAEQTPLFAECPKVRFLTADFDNLGFNEEFDAVVFFSALHHSLDEKAVLASVYKALKPGGVCICSEPGVGHEDASKEVLQKYDVTDRDMPPVHLIKIGREVGFRKFEVHQHADQLASVLYYQQKRPGRMQFLYKLPGLRYLALMYSLMFYKRYNGITLLVK